MSEHLPNNQIFIRKLTNIILANLGNDNFGPRELAPESGLSLYRLNRRLHSINRKTASQFIRELRLQKALELLRNEEYTVSEVAYKSGFSSPSYFISCFHEYFGYPPGKVKKEGLESHEENLSGREGLKHERKGAVRRIFILISAGNLVLAGLVYIVYILFSGNFSHDDGAPSINKRKSIAVLPFRNRSDDITDQYVYDGIMEEITNNLTKIQELGVISNTSVEQFRNTTKPVPEKRKMLDVDYILEAGGQKFGSTFRIRVQLIEVATDLHIWSKSFQQSMKKTRKLFRIQSRIARDIDSELKAAITQEEKELIEKVPTINWSAYNLYLKANSYQNDIKATHNHISYQTAVKLYSAAIAGYYGVPPIMVTGDEATCREAKKFFGNKIVTVPVKRGVARESAVLYPFEETRKALYEGAKRSVAAISACKPYVLETPVRVKEQYLNLDPSLPKPLLVSREGVAEDALHLFTWARK